MPNMPDSSGSLIVTEVKKFIGVPYVYGGESAKGFDCSGLVQYALTKLGYSGVPRTSEEQWKWVTKISASQLQPGDLIFSQWPGDGASPGHVAIYAGNGELIEAPKPGEDVHQIAFNSYYKGYVTGYGRVPGVAGATGTGGNPGTTGGGTTVNQASWLGDVGGWLGGLAGGVTGGISDVAGMIGNIFTPVGNTFKDFGKALEIAMHAVLWLVNPMNWVRIIAGVIGGASVIAGAVMVAQAA